MKCKHLTTTDALHIRADGSEQHIRDGKGLCVWADANPERFVDAPRWLTTWVLSGGPNFSPDRDCPGCPGYVPKEPAP